MVLLRISRNISVADISQTSTAQFQCHWFTAFLFSLQRTFGRKRNQNQRGSFKDGVCAHQTAHGCVLMCRQQEKDLKGNLASPAAEYEMIPLRSLDLCLSVCVCVCSQERPLVPSLTYFKHRHVVLLECVPLWHAKKKK